MNLIDYLIVAIIVLILGFCVMYIRKAKKKGVRCIGCPSGCKCSGHCSGCVENFTCGVTKQDHI